jgi:hypothetical protein
VLCLLEVPTQKLDGSRRKKDGGVEKFGILPRLVWAVRDGRPLSARGLGSFSGLDR